LIEGGLTARNRQAVPSDTVAVFEMTREYVMVNSLDVTQNLLIAALPPAQQQRWRAQLERVELPLGQVLYEPGQDLSHAYFPSTAIVSLLCVTRDGASAEVAVVGNEGMVGVPLLMGGESTPSRAVVRCGGSGFRLTAQAIKDEFHCAPVMSLLLHYTQALITQMAQTAVCNRHHSVEQQLCRLLLLSLDRLQGSELVMTHELIAQMLGVRREGVTEAALKLQSEGLIRYTRGHITVLDRAGLALSVCECYEVLRQEYDRLLPKKAAVLPFGEGASSLLYAQPSRRGFRAAMVSR
jgi:CRP-like cAMP-binding protein